MMPKTYRSTIGLGACIFFASIASAKLEAAPTLFSEVGFDPPVGVQIALHAPVVTEADEVVELGELLGNPTLLAPVYYRCPNLCDLTLEGVAELASSVRSRLGELHVVVVSFAAEETPADARSARATLSIRQPAVARDPHWHFLTAAPQDIAKIMASLGFTFTNDAETATYSHAAGAVALDAHGRILGLLPGIRFDAAEFVRIVDEGPTAEPAPPRALLWCFDYDAETGRYTLAIMKVLRLAGIAMVALILISMLLMNRSRRRSDDG